VYCRGENTLIGAGSIVKPGVTIGKNAIVGAGSVVVSDLPDEGVYFGNPARRKGSR
jgi:acetyltransferase-like isoleucine patch superfamily enzyme